MFGKKKVPKVTTSAFELTFNVRNEHWTLNYKDIPFYFSSHEILLPETEELDQYIEWTNSIKRHIDECVLEMFEGWDNPVNTSVAYIAQVEIEAPGKIAIMVLGDETWGDMGYDLWVKDGCIVDEGASD